MITRGFEGSRRRRPDSLPPGQYEVDSFPVLTAGPTPRVDTAEWALTVGDGTVSKTYDWNEFGLLPSEVVEVDIHCVTHWSKLGTKWEGVSVATLLEDAGVGDYPYALATSYGGYTTNVPVEDLLEPGSMVAIHHEGEPLEPEHGGPARLLVPHLYLWKSAKWIRELRLRDEDDPGFWESAGYHMYGDPWREQRYHND